MAETHEVFCAVCELYTRGYCECNPKPKRASVAPPPKRTFTMKVRMPAPTKGQPMPYDDDAAVAPPPESETP